MTPQPDGLSSAPSPEIPSPAAVMVRRAFSFQAASRIARDHSRGYLQSVRLAGCKLSTAPLADGAVPSLSVPSSSSFIPPAQAEEVS